MKYIKVLFILFLFVITLSGQNSPDSRIKDCKFKDKNLFGRVKIVTAFPDFKVKIVESFPDLNVMKVESFPDRCGRWKFVDSHEDFTIMLVDSHEDFTIKYVDSFPGMP